MAVFKETFYNSQTSTWCVQPVKISFQGYGYTHAYLIDIDKVSKSHRLCRKAFGTPFRGSLRQEVEMRG